MTCRLRRICRNDLDRVREWRMLPEITRHMYTDPQITPAEQNAWFERIAASAADLVWIIELAEADLPVGILSLTEIDAVNRRACWAYYIAQPEARGKGLAKTLELNIYRYVFEELQLNRLWCEVLTSNERVVSLHEKFGSRVEGVLREHVIKNGQKLDIVRMAVLASDWLEIKAQHAFTHIEIE